MRLSKQTNFAVRTLVYCAVNEPGLSRVSDIARAYHISEMFLFKIILPVVKQGLIETVRGRRGGVRLARPADQIRLGDVVRITEESFALSECMDHEEHLCPLQGRCAYTRVLRRALESFLAVLDEYTIADLVANWQELEAVLGLQGQPKRPSGISWGERLHPATAGARFTEKD